MSFLFCGIGPIPVRLNIHSGKTELFDVKTDNDEHHRKQERSELQIKLGVQNICCQHVRELSIGWKSGRTSNLMSSNVLVVKSRY